MFAEQVAVVVTLAPRRIAVSERVDAETSMSSQRTACAINTGGWAPRYPAWCRRRHGKRRRQNVLASSSRKSPMSLPAIRITLSSPSAAPAADAPSLACL